MGLFGKEGNLGGLSADDPEIIEGASAAERAAESIATYQKDKTNENANEIFVNLEKAYVLVSCSSNADDKALEELLLQTQPNRDDLEKCLGLKPEVYASAEGDTAYMVYTGYPHLTEEREEQSSWLITPFIGACKMVMEDSEIDYICINPDTQSFPVPREFVEFFLECNQ